MVVYISDSNPLGAKTVQAKFKAILYFLTKPFLKKKQNPKRKKSLIEYHWASLG